MSVSLTSTQQGDHPLTPISYPQRLLRPRIEHSRDDHESGRDRTFAHAQDQPDGEQAAEALARSMTAESDTPDEDVDAHPFSDGVPLEGEVLRVLEDEVAEVEDRA